ncbi:MAG: hypothetical protein Q7S40_05590 [Opitutaceae bacterium]|nr:hypothetical protein [Opitutaceae bacterium]
MRHTLSLVALALPVAAAPETQAQTESGVRVLALKPTVLFPNQEPLRQVARLEFENRGAAILSADVRVSVGGAAPIPSKSISIAPRTAAVRGKTLPRHVDVNRLCELLRSQGAVVSARINSPAI